MADFHSSETRPKKSLVVAYALWVFLGIFGAHRYYLGKYFTGFLYTISCGLYFVGWVADLFLLPLLVRKVNQSKDEEEVESTLAWPASQAPMAPTPYIQRESGSVATQPRTRRAEPRVAPGHVEVQEESRPAWAVGRTRAGWFEFALRAMFFLVAPGLFTAFALMLELWQLMAIFVACLVVLGLLSGVDSLLLHAPQLESAPGVGNALGYLKRLSSFYKDQRPFPFVYYLFYPITAPLACLTSALARKEVSMFTRLIGGLIAVVVAPLGLSYFSVYPPHLGPREAFTIMFVHVVFVLIMMIGIFIPIVTTALTLNAVKAKKQLRFLVCLGLISSLPLALAWHSTSPFSYMAVDLVKERLGRQSFQDELTASATMFLDFWGKRLGHEPVAGLQSTAFLPFTPTPHEELTQKLQRHVGGIVVGSEAQVFHVLAWQEESAYEHGGPWLAIATHDFLSDKPPRLLFVAQADGRAYTRWQELPPVIACRFKTDAQNPNPVFVIADTRLIKDLEAK